LDSVNGVDALGFPSRKLHPGPLGARLQAFARSQDAGIDHLLVISRHGGDELLGFMPASISLSAVRMIMNRIVARGVGWSDSDASVHCRPYQTSNGGIEIDKPPALAISGALKQNSWTSGRRR
jgi:hypothetical protein